MTEKKWIRLPSGKLINTDLVTDAEWQNSQRTELCVWFVYMQDKYPYTLHDEDAYALYMFLVSISYPLEFFLPRFVV